MAIQGEVRALVRAADVDALRRRLLDDAGVPLEAIDVEVAAAGAYRDEAPDLELGRLVDDGRTWLVVAVLGGALVGALLALAIPALREATLLTIPLFAFAGAWASGAVVTARRVQLRRSSAPRGETVHHVDADEQGELRVLTIRDLGDRDPALEVLVASGAHLLDTRHPRVGTDEPGARPTGLHQDGQGPPAR